MNKISIIAAVAENRVIGREGKLPWYLPNDLRYFKKTTIGNIVVMGRKTYQSIGKPLPHRVNIVFSQNSNLPGNNTYLHYEESDDLFSVNSIHSFCRLIDDYKDIWKDKEIFVIGGSKLFSLFLPFTSKLYLTRIKHTVEGNTHFPDLDENEWKIIQRREGTTNDQNEYHHEFVIMERITPSQNIFEV